MSQSISVPDTKDAQGRGGVGVRSFWEELLVLLMLFLRAHAAAADVAVPQGEWQETDFFGVTQPNPASACAWASYKTRKIAIQRNPDQSLTGVYVTYELSFWTLYANPSCTFPEPTMSNALSQRSRLWPFRVTRTGDATWHVVANEARCIGDGCNDANLLKSGFDTTLQVNGESVIDTGADVKGGSGGLRFRSMDRVRMLSNGALSAFDALMRPFDSGECNTFVNRSVTRDSPLRIHQGDFCTIVRQNQSLRPPVSGSTVINAIPIDRMVDANGLAKEVAEVLVDGSVTLQDGSKLPRAVILRQENGDWKVYAMLAQ